MVAWSACWYTVITVNGLFNHRDSRVCHRGVGLHVIRKLSTRLCQPDLATRGMLRLGYPIETTNRHQIQFGQDVETPLRDVSISGAISSDSWAWVELNYRPHAYQAASYEHEIGSEVPTRLPFTNILLSISRI
jgi:hypothetical protein